MGVGDYRVVFSKDHKEPELFVIDILPRGGKYE
ncbi:MAG: type II toxin-antitoxin system RelE family toxin [Candidatus Bathyarchaeia archaeon]